MKTDKSPLEGKTSITFGQPPANQRAALPVILAIAGTTVLLFLDGILTKFSDLMFVSNSTLIVYGMLYGLRQSIQIDLDNQTYFIRGINQAEPKNSGGRLTDIRRVSVSRAVYAESFTLHVHLEFHPEANQGPYRIDHLPCSVSGREMQEKMLLYLDLASRLNVPLRDDSGWNGEYPPIKEPNEIVVKPGETHPVFLRPVPPPKKWNKW